MVASCLRDFVVHFLFCFDRGICRRRQAEELPRVGHLQQRFGGAEFLHRRAVADLHHQRVHRLVERRAEPLAGCSPDLGAAKVQPLNERLVKRLPAIDRTAADIDLIGHIIVVVKFEGVADARALPGTWYFAAAVFLSIAAGICADFSPREQNTRP